MFTSRQLALHAARLASNKGAEAIRVLQLPADAGTVFDYAVLASGRSSRQTTTIVDEVFHFCKRHGVPRMPVEGDAGWMLVDCYDVVVHALEEETRARYDLDRLWPRACEVDWEQEVADLDDPDRPAKASRTKPPARRRAAKPAAGEPAEAAAKPAPKRRRAASRAPRQEGADAELPATLPPEFEPKPRRRSAGRPRR